MLWSIENGLKNGAMKHLRNNAGILHRIIDNRKKYWNKISSKIDSMEKFAVKGIGQKLIEGRLTFGALLGSKEIRPYSNGTGNQSIRKINQVMSQLMDEMNVEGIREVVRKYPREAIEAGNFVNPKTRYVIQSIIAQEVAQLHPRKGV